MFVLKLRDFGRLPRCKGDLPSSVNFRSVGS